jgi:hypothetical protein
MKTIGALLGALLLLAGPAAVAANALDCRLKRGIAVQTSRAGICGFDPARRSFAGSAREQADCLLRPVGEGGSLGAANLPDALADLVGKPADLPLQTVRAFLARQGVMEADLGGPVTEGVRADYFIIHDTSTPNCSDPNAGATSCPSRGHFPPNRDEAGWIDNATFNGYARSGLKIVHVMTNRVGQSFTMVDFGRHMPSTKFESCVDAAQKVKLFIAAENVQPRIGWPAIPPAGTRANHLLTPTPGLTARQYDRLALLYVVASARHGKWLIPAYHAVLDQYYVGGHDDPQNFDIGAFSEAIQRTLAGMRGR